MALTPPAVTLDEQPAVPAETPLAPTRRGKREPRTSAIAEPWECDMPGIRSSEIRGELARRKRRATKLLAQREHVLAALADIEVALDALGEDTPAWP